MTIDLEALLGDDGTWREALAAAGQDRSGAEALAEALRGKARERDDLRGVARALILEGGAAWPAGDYERAAGCLDGALTALDAATGRATDAPGAQPGVATVGPERATAQSELGVVRAYLTDHAGALAWLRAALADWRTLGDEAGEAEALNRIGMVFLHTGDHEEARTAFTASLALRERVGTPADAAGTHNNLGKALTALGDGEGALAHLEQACRRWEEAGDWRGLAMALNNTGVLLEQRGDPADAAACYAASLELKDARGDPHGASESRRRLGRLRVAEGRVEEGVALLERAAAEAERIGARDELAEACAALADAHESAGDPAAALGWHRRLREVERRLFDEASDERLRALQVQHQLDLAVRDSHTDPLTGLANRRALERRLREELAAARERRRSLAVAIADLDFFKWVNDHCSHAVGDAVLRAVATLLREHTRASDTVARYGGEEFVVLLPGCSRTDGLAIAEEIVAAVRGHDWPALDPGLAVTVSLGVAVTDGSAEPGTVLAAADANLYRAKHDGKDRARG